MDQNIGELGRCAVLAWRRAYFQLKKARKEASASNKKTAYDPEIDGPGVDGPGVVVIPSAVRSAQRRCRGQWQASHGLPRSRCSDKDTQTLTSDDPML